MKFVYKYLYYVLWCVQISAVILDLNQFFQWKQWVLIHDLTSVFNREFSTNHFFDIYYLSSYRRNHIDNLLSYIISKYCKLNFLIVWDPSYWNILWFLTQCTEIGQCNCITWFIITNEDLSFSFKKQMKLYKIHITS